MNLNLRMFNDEAKTEERWAEFVQRVDETSILKFKRIGNFVAFFPSSNVSLVDGAARRGARRTCAKQKLTRND